MSNNADDASASGFPDLPDHDSEEFKKLFNMDQLGDSADPNDTAVGNADPSAGFVVDPDFDELLKGLNDTDWNTNPGVVEAPTSTNQDTDFGMIPGMDAPTSTNQDTDFGMFHGMENPTSTNQEALTSTINPSALTVNPTTDVARAPSAQDIMALWNKYAGIIEVPGPGWTDAHWKLVNSLEDMAKKTLEAALAAAQQSIQRPMAPAYQPPMQYGAQGQYDALAQPFNSYAAAPGTQMFSQGPYTNEFPGMQMAARYGNTGPAAYGVSYHPAQCYMPPTQSEAPTPTSSKRHRSLDDSSSDEPVSRGKRQRKSTGHSSSHCSSGHSSSHRGSSDSGTSSELGYSQNFDIKRWGDKGQFKYLPTGYLVAKESLMSHEDMETFLTAIPPHRAGKMTLWIGRMPFACNERFAPCTKKSLSQRCRYAGCPQKDGTLEKGTYHVLLDEFQGCRQVPDPFLLPRMHLWCLERFFDFPKLCRTLNVKMENRSIFAPGASEDKQARGMILTNSQNKGHTKTIEAGKTFLDYCKRSGGAPPISNALIKIKTKYESPEKTHAITSVFGDYPASSARGDPNHFELLDENDEDVEHGPYVGTLGWRLGMIKYEVDPALKRHAQERARPSAARSTFHDHLFDLPIYANGRRYTRRTSHQLDHLAEKGKSSRRNVADLIFTGPKVVPKVRRGQRAEEEVIDLTAASLPGDLNQVGEQSEHQIVSEDMTFQHESSVFQQNQIMSDNLHSQHDARLPQNETSRPEEDDWENRSVDSTDALFC